ncbi:MAG: 4-hydroxy-tetrahydrodipicolinate reductase [Candidatus Dadabacteria bacterium]|nr:4-hydroxy-tetrahydrodipicolinate reductase [Candidatus Dadabacteria bacterium]NIS10176.1 4-hydroxy-tetrahydrodipicolinate reductase [Candidatus Dadabacteria bacterium]NIY23088.1 4-hydroxy-tetrahydrodipicolinate reductase [Candidatus Dadabacteria bacterium]
MGVIRAGVVGVGGKMGERILSLLLENGDFEVAGATEVARSRLIGKDVGSLSAQKKTSVTVSDNLDDAFKDADGIIDFTSPESTLMTAEYAAHYSKALVVGTTGFDEKQKVKLTKLAYNFPCVFSPNMSVGVNVMFEMSKKLTELLGADFDIEILEAHHRNKKDSPSGTALRIAEVVSETLDKNLNDIAVYSRHGNIGARKKGELGIQTLRGGDVVGEHSLIFYGDGERVEFTHKASSRDTFANGAIRALRWVHDKPAGIYTMKDVLGF